MDVYIFAERTADGRPLSINIQVAKLAHEILNMEICNYAFETTSFL